MKRQPPTHTENFFAWFFRKVYKKLFRLKTEPGDHPCWKCSLYDPKNGVCLIIIDRGKYAPKDEKGFRITELRRVWPFDFCVRFLDKELGRIVVFDPDSPEHRIGKEELNRLEEEARRRQEHNEDQRLLDLVSNMRNKKKASASVSTKETGMRGDPWLFTNAEDAGGHPPTNHN
jgi:hypothetical protein